MNRTIVLVGLLVVLSANLACGPHSFDSPLCESNEETVTFFLLGMLDEYMGRRFHEGGSDVVERFYPGEGREAAIFEACLLDYNKLAGTTQAVEIEVRKQGHIYLKSRAHCDMLNSFYDYGFESGVTQVSTGQRTTAESLSGAVFEGASRSAMLAFVSGAYCRYGDGRSFTYANSGKRAGLVVELLKEIGCQEVELEVTEGIPFTHRINFQSTAELDTWLNVLKGAARE